MRYNNALGQLMPVCSIYLIPGKRNQITTLQLNRISRLRKSHDQNEKGEQVTDKLTHRKSKMGGEMTTRRNKPSVIQSNRPLCFPPVGLTTQHKGSNMDDSATETQLGNAWTQ